MRSSKEACIGDTIHLKSAKVEPLPGFKEAKPMVYAGVYPMDQSQYLALQSAIEKLTLNDNAVSVAKETRYIFAYSRLSLYHRCFVFTTKSIYSVQL